MENLNRINSATAIHTASGRNLTAFHSFLRKSQSEKRGMETANIHTRLYWHSRRDLCCCTCTRMCRPKMSLSQRAGGLGLVNDAACDTEIYLKLYFSVSWFIHTSYFKMMHSKEILKR